MIDFEQRHLDDVAAGNHDHLCEWGLRTFPSSEKPVMVHMCHCSKRRRQLAGKTELPGPVFWRAPACPECYDDLSGDGDSWYCSGCCVSWGASGDYAEWTDEYGDLGTAAR